MLHKVRSLVSKSHGMDLGFMTFDIVHEAFPHMGCLHAWTFDRIQRISSILLFP